MNVGELITVTMQLPAAIADDPEQVDKAERIFVEEWTYNVHAFGGQPLADRPDSVTRVRDHTPGARFPLTLVGVGRAVHNDLPVVL